MQGQIPQSLPSRLSNLSGFVSTFLRGEVHPPPRRSYKTPIYPVIDLDSTPALPNGCTLECNHFVGKMTWNKSLESKKKFLAPENETIPNLKL